MIGNHYPTLYGSDHAWVALGVIVVMGVAIKHAMNVLGEIQGIVWASVAAVVGAIALLGLNTLDRTAVEVPEPTAARPIDPARTGTIVGSVRFEGTVPPGREVTLINCALEGQATAVLQPVRVADGHLADVFVWLEDADGWDVPPPPAEAVVVDQRGCLYAPRVVGARTGQTVAFLNSDPVPHNVRAVASANPVFNDMMVVRDSRIDKVFLKPEVMIEARCDIHPWMTAHVGVVAHPWFAVTGEDGRFTLRGVPEGTYSLAAWHEVYGIRRQQVAILPGGSVAVTLQYAP
jgi:plastocyanin